MLNFFSALSFLTIIPCPKNAPWENEQKVLYFPLVGLLIGGMLCGLDFIFGLLFNDQVRAALDVLFLAVISGGLHLDGLADTADGIFSSKPRDKVLEIMKDPRSGAMGVLAIVFCVLLKYAGLGALSNSNRWVWLLTAPAFARAAQAMGLVFMEYARKEGGIASNLFKKNNYNLLIFCPLPFIFPFLFNPGIGLAAMALFIFSGAMLFFYFKRKINGMTGDTLGASSEIIETIFLVFGGIL